MFDEFVATGETRCWKESTTEKPKPTLGVVARRERESNCFVLFMFERSASLSFR